MVGGKAELGLESRERWIGSIMAQDSRGEVNVVKLS